MLTHNPPPLRLQQGRSSFSEWPKYHLWRPVGGLWHLIFYAKTHGFRHCSRWVGERVLIGFGGKESVLLCMPQGEREGVLALRERSGEQNRAPSHVFSALVQLIGDCKLDKGMRTLIAEPPAAASISKAAIPILDLLPEL